MENDNNKTENDDDIEVSSLGSGSSLRFKDILMAQVNRSVVNGNTEFRGGFYTTVENKKGESKEIYVLDSRSVFDNGVYLLSLLLKPKFDKTMKEAHKKFKSDLAEMKKKFIEATSVDEKVILGEAFYESEKDKVLLETLKNQQLELHLVLFSELCELLSRKRFLEVGAGSF